MSKRKAAAARPSAAAAGHGVPHAARDPTRVVPNPPRKNFWFLLASLVAVLLWLGFLLTMALWQPS
jgi:hypothetical protein